MTPHNSFHWTLAFLFWSVGPMQSCIFYNGIRTFLLLLLLLCSATAMIRNVVPRSLCFLLYGVPLFGYYYIQLPHAELHFLQQQLKNFFRWFFHCVTISQFFRCVVLPLATRNVVSRVPTAGKAIESLVKMQFVPTFPYLHLARLTK